MKKTLHSFLCHNSFADFPIAENSAALVVTSPPYPMIEMWDDVYAQYDHTIRNSLDHGRGMEAFEKMHSLLDCAWKSCFDVLIDGGFACINIGDSTRTVNGRFGLFSNQCRVISAMESFGFQLLPSIIWHKPSNSPTKFMGSGMLPAGAYVTHEHEHILIFRKGEKRTFNTDQKRLRGQSALFWEERNIFFSDRWTIAGITQFLKMKSHRSRSAAFPLPLAQRLIAMYSIAGDLVIDPFSGTGTTAMAALISGRNSLSFDNDPSLIDASQKQFTKHGVKNTFNKIIHERMMDHLRYVSSKDELFFRYQNEAHKVPVKTLQEKKLIIRDIVSITRSPETIEARYKKLSKGRIKEMINSLNESPVTPQDLDIKS